MPNTEVKLQRAESSWGIAPCEDRASPRKLSTEVSVLFFIGGGPPFADLAQLAEQRISNA